MMQNGKVVGTVTLADPHVVFAESHVQHPVDTVLDAPMAQDGGQDPFRVGLQAGNVVPDLVGDLVSDPAFAVDHDNRGQHFPGGPLPQIGQKIGVINHPTAAHFEAAMPFIDRAALIVLGVAALGVLGILKQLARFGVKMRLVVLDGQGVLATPRLDGLGDLFLAAHRVNGHDTTLHDQRLEHFGRAGISLE
jgi:hypothetical protein